jgi:hypothetical protein
MRLIRHLIVLLGTIPALSAVEIANDDPQLLEMLKKHGVDLESAMTREYKSIDALRKTFNRYMEQAVIRKYGPRQEKRVQEVAAELYPLYKIGDTLTATVGVRTVTGRLTRIKDLHVVIASVTISKEDFPAGAFDAELNKQAREHHFDKAFTKPRQAYKDELVRNQPIYYRKFMIKNGYIDADGAWITHVEFIKRAKRRVAEAKADAAARGEDQ